MHKNILAIAAASMLALAAAPVAAQMMLYDNFKKDLLKSQKWDLWSISGSAVEVLRKVRKGKLNLQLRGIGDTSVTGGRWTANNAIQVATDPNAIHTIRVRGTMRKPHIVECTDPAANGNTRILAPRIAGYFTSDGNDTADDATGVVWAAMSLRRSHGDGLKNNQARFVGQAFLCEDASCGNGTDLGFETIKVVKLNKGKVNFDMKIEFDAAGNRFHYTANGETLTIDIDPALNVAAPVQAYRAIMVQSRVDNCAGNAKRPTTAGEVFIDKVWINK